MFLHCVDIENPDRNGIASDGQVSATDGQSIGAVIFEFVPHDRVFMAGKNDEGGFLTTSYATHHGIPEGGRAGFGDLLIGAGALRTLPARARWTKRYGITCSVIAVATSRPRRNQLPAGECRGGGKIAP